MLDWLAALPSWAVSVTVSAIVSVGVCLLNVVVAWWLDRIRRTIAEVNALMSLDSVKDLLFEEEGHADKMRESKAWVQYQREVLRPGLDAIERFAMPAVTGIPRIYSRRIVRKLACQVLVSIWSDEHVQHYVHEMRKQAQSPGTTYADFERLAKWLRDHPL